MFFIKELVFLYLNNIEVSIVVFDISDLDWFFNLWKKLVEEFLRIDGILFFMLFVRFFYVDFISWNVWLIFFIFIFGFIVV